MSSTSESRIATLWFTRNETVCLGLGVRCVVKGTLWVSMPRRVVILDDILRECWNLHSYWTRSMGSKEVLEHFVNLSSFYYWYRSCVLRRENDCYQAECLWIGRLCAFSFVNGNDEVCGTVSISVWGAEFGDLTMPKLLIVWKDCELTKLYYHVCYILYCRVYEEFRCVYRRRQEGLATQVSCLVLLYRFYCTVDS